MLAVQERTIGKVTCLDLAGRLEGEVASSQLRDTVTGLVRRGARDLVLNFERVNRVDTLGLGTVVLLRQRVRDAGGRICVVRLTRRVRDVLTITRLLGLFDHFDSEQEAAEWLALEGSDPPAIGRLTEGERLWQL